MVSAATEWSAKKEKLHRANAPEGILMTLMSKVGCYSASSEICTDCMSP